ncbi:guanylate cyclase [Elysia marginata]|uniref:Guanylate cyclase n=1 Tax=Elysia marginata TaxID=1093978 RepID=A0AAV4H8C7_9GAST|nr:guanylate cyclase [Elysia marginata]
MAAWSNQTPLVLINLFLFVSSTGHALQFLHTLPNGPVADALLNFDYEPQSHSNRPTNHKTHASISARPSGGPLAKPSLPGLEFTGIAPNSIVTNAENQNRLALFPYKRDTGTPHTAFSEPVPPWDNSTLTLGYLVVDRSRAYVAFRGWKVVSGALSYAIEKINKESIIPGYNLTYVIRDIRGLTNDSLLEMSKLWRDGVVGFIGPVNTCKNEALLAAAWNLPMLSHMGLGGDNCTLLTLAVSQTMRGNNSANGGQPKVRKPA